MFGLRWHLSSTSTADIPLLLLLVSLWRLSTIESIRLSKGTQACIHQKLSTTTVICLSNTLGPIELPQFRPMIPKTPLAPSSAYVLLLPSLLLLFMASLARMRGMWPLRMGLLPLALAVTLRVYLGYYCENPELVGANHGLGES